MEDRATLRIAVQLVHNWLVHAVTTRPRVQDILMEMAATVDLQNKSNADYIPLLSPPGLPPSLALVAAAELIDTGGLAPQGYTEPVLHKYRLLVKQRGASKL
jgi:malate synthase